MLGYYLMPQEKTLSFVSAGYVGLPWAAVFGCAENFCWMPNVSWIPPNWS